jgi:N-acetylglucosaminyl-diphospho-decaprenol L-rhamnosyltransferase
MIPKIDIIIVNWNSGMQLRDCLASIKDTDNDNYDLNKVVVVDNASSDASAESLEKFGLPLKIFKNNNNIGFSKACNQGASNTEADYLLFLNPDTRLFFDTLSNPIKFMEKPQNKHVGICGIQLVDELGNYTTSFARFPNNLLFLASALGLDKIPNWSTQRYLMNEDKRYENGEVDQIIGAFFLVRENVFVSLQGFDERFFIYFEEVDFSLRAKQIGYSSYYLSDVKAFHKCGGCSDSVKSDRLFYTMRSRLQYGFKHFSIMQQMTLLLITFFLEFLTRNIASMLGRSGSDLRETIVGYRKLFSHFFLSRANDGNT